MKEKDALKLKGGNKVLLNDGKIVVIDDIATHVYEYNKTVDNPKKRTQWIVAGYADKEHPYGVRVYLFPAQIVRVVSER